jgi:enoyl-CoA hydratase/carnithine racemase
VELTLARIVAPRDLDAVSVAALARDLEAACASPAPVVLLTGFDDTTFCLGLAVGRSHAAPAATDAFADLLLAMHLAPKPLVAAVDGQAIGGGLGLVCACDWVVATDRATFALPELLWGLVPAIIWPVITDRMALHAARQWTLSAHTRTAAEGIACGLVDELVPPDRVARAVARSARMLRRLEPGALVRMRTWARESRRHDLAAALRGGAAITSRMVREPAVANRWRAFEQGETPWSD